MKDFELKSDIVFCDKLAGIEDHLAKNDKIFLVYDPAVESLVPRIPVEFAGKLALDKVDEAHKTYETAVKICEWLMSSGADRNAFILALGGGIVTDIAGFAASIYKRGVRCGYIPTTLLAQVDAAIGGKTGVNHLSYKNMLGTFKLPEFTFICREVLETLPFEVFRNGLAEMLKTFIIDDGGKFNKMVNALKKANFSDSPEGFFQRLCKTEFFELIEAAASVKGGVVSRDFLEKGERTKLNLGHTFAHAIEWCSAQKNDGISHGEAVATGLAMSARLSVKLGLAAPEVLDKILSALEACGLPAECPYPATMLAGAMARDKKAVGEKINFVLIRSIGDVIVQKMTVEEAL